MAGREELYLKHIAENTGRIAKVLEKVLTKDEYDDTVNTLLDFSSYYNDHAESELDRRKAREIWLAVENYIELIGKKEVNDDKNRT